MICRFSPVGGRVTSHHQLRLTIANTSRALGEWLETRFGGRIRWRRQQQSVRPSWEWVMQHKHAAALIRRVLPYLVIKQEQARLALEFQKQKVDFTGKGRVSDDELTIRENFRTAMSAMNHRVGESELCGFSV